MIRIAYIGIKEIPSNRGADRVVEGIVSNIDKEKYEAIVYCMKKRNKKNKATKGVKIVNIITIPIRNIDMILYMIFTAIHVMTKNYDILHIHNIDGAFIIPILNIKYRRNTIGTTHGRPQLVDKWDKTTKIYFKCMERCFIKHIKTITSVSKPLAEELREEYNCHALYIPNGIYTDDIVDITEAEKVLQKNKIYGEYILFASGRIIPIKGLHELLESLAKIKQQLQLVVIGSMDHSGRYKEKLQMQIKKQKAIHVGFVAEKSILHGLIKKTKIFIFPSRVEAMSIMMLEVASLNVPMICSNIPANKEILNSEEVLYYDVGDAKNLSEQIEWALNNEDKMKKRAKKARKRINSEYVWPKIAKQYETLYEETINRSKKR